MSTVSVGLENKEKAQLALDRLFGITHKWKRVEESQMVRWVRGEVIEHSVPAFPGLPEAYVHFTGDHSFTGPSSRKISAELSSAGFANALGATLNKALIQSYAEEDYGIDKIIPQSARKSVPNFKTQERIRVGYLGDLEQVDPESSDWPEVTAPTDEKASYSVVSFGGMLTVTRKAIIDDEIGFVTQSVSRLGRAARRTLAQRVVNLITANAAIYDGITWAHASSHGANLRTTALSGAEIEAIAAVMYAQTEKDSGKILGLEAYLLMVPRALQATARAANEQPYTDANYTHNPAKGRFGQNSERIVTCPLFTDTTDFATFADPEIAPCLEIGFLQGRQEPELLLADNPGAGVAFTGDRIQYKIRHEYEVTPIDYRGYVRSVVS